MPRIVNRKFTDRVPSTLGKDTFRDEANNATIR